MSKKHDIPHDRKLMDMKCDCCEKCWMSEASYPRCVYNGPYAGYEKTDDKREQN
jgi:hypothetical protein